MSVIHDDIDRALAAHGMWKVRLRTAIHQGKLDTSPADLRRDDRCDFGRWLQGGQVPDVARRSSHFALVVRMHAEFHKAAAAVAELALAGSKDAATRMLNSGEYARASEALVSAMQAWRNATQ